MRTRRAFTLIELLVVIAIIALLIGILLPAIGAARETARRAACLSGQRQFAVAAASYQNDFRDAIAAYSWRQQTGVPTPSSFPDLQMPGDDGEAAIFQAVDIIRRRTYLTNLPVPSRLPHREYSHLVLIDYLTLNLPEPIVACPSDRQRKLWQEDPTDRTNVPMQGQWAQTSDWLWFSSTYQVVPASWQPDMQTGNDRVFTQVPTDHNWFNGGGQIRTGGRRALEVTFPSQKAFMFEFYDYHTTRNGVFYAYDQAQIALQFFDGSVRVYKSDTINPGFKPERPQAPNPTTMWYVPQPFEPPLIGQPNTPLPGRVRWTRGGLRGIDVGGAEVYTGQPRD